MADLGADTAGVGASAADGTTPAVERSGVYWSLAAFGVAAASGLVLNVIIENRFDTKVLGRFNLALAVFLIGGQVGALGIQSAVLYFTPRAKALGEPTSQVLRAALKVNVLSGLVAAAAIVGGGVIVLRVAGSRDFSTALVAIGIGLVLYPVNKSLLAYVNGLRRIRFFSMGFAGRYVLLVVIVVTAAAVGAPGTALPWAISGAETVLTLVLVALLWRDVTDRTSRGAVTGVERELVRFGLRGMVGGLLLDLNTRVDLLILGGIAGSAAAGRYSVASAFAEGLYQLCLATRSSYDPLVATLHVRGEREALRATLVAARRRLYLIVVPLGVVSVAAYPLVVRVLFSRDLGGGTWGAYAILAGGVVFASGYIPFLSLLQQTGHPREQSVLLGLVSLTNIVANVALVPVFGVLGAALGAAAAQVLFVPFHRILARRTLGWAL